MSKNRGGDIIQTLSINHAPEKESLEMGPSVKFPSGRKYYQGSFFIMGVGLCMVEQLQR
jgi:hypothetical protein